MDSVLLLAYFFPPLGGAGVQRPVKWVKYLPQHGWQPTVLTTRSQWYPVKDPTLGDDVPPGTPIIRAADPGALRLVAQGLGLTRLSTLRAIAAFPDEELAWLPAAVAAGLRHIRRARPDVILTTSAPFTSHLAGLVLHRVTGVPWVADFRDEWALNPEAGERPAPTDRWAVELERRVVETAAAVVVTSDAAVLAGAPPGDPKRVTITNGVDPDDAVAVAPADRSARFRIATVGSLYGGRDARPVLEALARTVARGDVDPQRAEFRVVGNVWLAQAPDAGPVPVELTGYVDHATAMREMAAADLLVAHLPSHSRAIPGKLFEYMTAGRPILAVMDPATPGFRIVQELGVGDAVAPDDAAGLERVLTARFEQWQAGSPGIGEDVAERVLARFGRAHLAGQLAALLTRVARA